MNIKLKIIFITGIIGICIILVTALLASKIIMPGFTNVEDSRIKRNTDRVNDALIEKIKSIDSTANDYAVWDETYAAVKGEIDNYGETGVTPGSLGRTKIDFVVLMRNDGTVMFGRKLFYGEETEYNATSESNDELYSYLEENYASIVCLNETAHYEGFIQLPDGFAMISTRPILRSDESGPVEGTIIFGKMIDQSFVDAIAQQTHTLLKIHPYRTAQGEDKIKIKDFLRTNNSDEYGIFMEITSTNEEYISGIIILKDVYGKPMATAEAIEYRDIYIEGKSSVNYIIKSMIIAIIILIFLEFLFFDKVIISRLTSITNQLKNIQRKKNNSSRVSIDGADEISSFVNALNYSLDTIEKSNEERQIILDANPNTYIYVDSTLKIDDYRLTGNLKNTIEKKKIIDLRGMNLSKIFSSDIVKKLDKARIEAKTTCRPTDDMHGCKPAEVTFKYSETKNSSFYEAKIINVSKDDMCLILLEDITERKKYEEKLVDTNKHLKDLDSAKTDFLNIASHELKTPLTAISAYIDVLDDYKGKFNQEQTKGLDAIKRNSNQLKLLINNILEVSRMDSQRFDLNITELDVKEKVSQVVSNLKILSDNKHIELKYKCNGVDKITTDAMRFEEILNNLVSNAIKFTEKGSVTVKTESGKNKEQGFIVISVIDTGIGIPRNKIGKIFQKFYQVNKTLSRKYGGTGLGLPITKKIIELQGGKLTVSSKVGKGTIFRATLPIVGKKKDVAKLNVIAKDAVKTNNTNNTSSTSKDNKVAKDKETTKSNNTGNIIKENKLSKDTPKNSDSPKQINKKLFKKKK